jgi:hypothetical protein
MSPGAAGSDEPCVWPLAEGGPAQRIRPWRSYGGSRTFPNFLRS